MCAEMFCYVSTMALGLGLFSLTVAVSICCILHMLCSAVQAVNIPSSYVWGKHLHLWGEKGLGPEPRVSTALREAFPGRRVV